MALTTSSNSRFPAVCLRCPSSGNQWWRPLCHFNPTTHRIVTAVQACSTSCQGVGITRPWEASFLYRVSRLIRATGLQSGLGTLANGVVGITFTQMRGLRIRYLQGFCTTDKNSPFMIGWWKAGSFCTQKWIQAQNYYFQSTLSY